MDQRTRMFKGLAALALSMTIAAALLSWLEPAKNPPLVARSLGRVEAFVRFAVATADAIRPAAWRGIEIAAADPQERWRRQTLTAVRSEDDHHFRILLTGEVEALPAWRQQHFEPSGGAIRILLDAAVESEPVPASQWLALRTLLRELHTLAEPPDQPGSLRWFITLSQDAKMPSSLRDLLSRDGFLG